MSFESQMYDVLSGLAPTYPEVLPVGATLPAITYQRVSTRRIRSHGGTSLIEPLYQIGCWSNSSSEARVTARMVIDAYESLMGEALVEDTREGYLPDAKLYRVMVDVRLVAGLDEEVEAS